MRTLLVTGHTGFVGRAVGETLQADSAEPRWRLAALPDDFDVRSPLLANHVDAIRPDAVLHLAGRTSVADSFADPDAFFEVNFHGTWNLLRALKSAGFAGRIVYVSSGDCYGAVPPDELPVSEDRPLRPRSPYAVSKAAAESLCYQWSQTEGLPIVIARPFNHLGRHQDPRFAVASFARQVARIKVGAAASPILTGDLDVTRDFTDVRDVVRAYFALLENGRTGEVYNVGSGREARLRDVIDALISIAGVQAETVTDPMRLRAEEQRRALADVRKIARDTGWSASIPLQTTLRDMLDDWNGRIKLE